MNEEQLALWKKIEVYSLDREGSSFPFSAKLGRENHWSHSLTRRVIEEYKRYVFLGMASGHPVSPSGLVDEVWHLHLTYTEEYWTRFCGEILGSPFHHNPSQGSAEETAKFGDWYRKTLESYERLFGETPPRDIWPTPEEKRADRTVTLKVDKSKHWIVRKPRLPGRLSLLGALLPLLVLFGCAEASQEGNPFNYRGPEFLSFFVQLYAIFFVAAVVVRVFLVRMALRGNTPRTDFEINGRPPDLTPCELAYLTGGRTRAAQAAVASMAATEGLEIDPISKVLTATPRQNPFADSLQEEAWNVVANQGIY